MVKSVSTPPESGVDALKVVLVQYCTNSCRGVVLKRANSCDKEVLKQ